VLRYNNERVLATNTDVTLTRSSNSTQHTHDHIARMHTICCAFLVMLQFVTVLFKFSAQFFKVLLKGLNGLSAPVVKKKARRLGTYFCL
jgi:hypothetical protein